MLFTVQLHQRTDARACDPDFDQFQDIRNFVQLRTTFLTTSAVRSTTMRPLVPTRADCPALLTLCARVFAQLSTEDAAAEALKKLIDKASDQAIDTENKQVSFSPYLCLCLSVYVSNKQENKQETVKRLNEAVASSSPPTQKYHYARG
jgi:hypothetical protein